MPKALDPENFKDRDEPLNVDMDPEEALRHLLRVDPNGEPVKPKKPSGEQPRRK